MCKNILHVYALITNNSKLLNNHISIRHSYRDPFLCDECDFTTSSNKYLKRHIVYVHRVYCEYQAKRLLYEHVRRRHNKVVDESYFDNPPRRICYFGKEKSLS
jgi:hypothetical protein